MASWRQRCPLSDWREVPLQKAILFPWTPYEELGTRSETMVERLATVRDLTYPFTGSIGHRIDSDATRLGWLHQR